MTKPAIIPQAAIERAISAARKKAPGSRVIIDHVRQRVEIVLSPAGSMIDSAEDDDNPWIQADGPA